MRNSTFDRILLFISIILVVLIVIQINGTSKWIITMVVLCFSVLIFMCYFSPSKSSTKLKFLSKTLVEEKNNISKKYRFIYHILIGTSFLCITTLLCLAIRDIWFGSSDIIKLLSEILMIIGLIALFIPFIIIGIFFFGGMIRKKI
jgi:hypothetical protein